MSKILLTIASVLTVSLIGVAQPKLEVVGGTKLDLGSVYRGQQVERKVTLKNTGTQLLEIERVDAACGCTGTTVLSNKIAPGKTGELLIKFNSTNFSGPVHKSVIINSNAQGAPQTTVEFMANVVQEISISPAQFWFRDSEAGKLNTATITLLNQGKEKVELTGYNTNLSGFSLRLPSSSIKPGESVQLIAEFTPKEASGILNDGVSLKTSSKTEPDVFVRIFGTFKNNQVK